MSAERRAPLMGSSDPSSTKVGRSNQETNGELDSWAELVAPSPASRGALEEQGKQQKKSRKQQTILRPSMRVEYQVGRCKIRVGKQQTPAPPARRGSPLDRSLVPPDMTVGQWLDAQIEFVLASLPQERPKHIHITLAVALVPLALFHFYLRFIYVPRSQRAAQFTWPIPSEAL